MINLMFLVSKGNAVRIPANSLYVINAFCKDVEVGEYFMPKHSFKNGVLIA